MIRLFLFSLLLAVPALGQDLSFQVASSPEYVRYLRVAEATFAAQITDDDTPAVANARAGRALVQIALVHTTTDSLIGALLPLFEDEVGVIETVYERDLRRLDPSDVEAFVEEVMDLVSGDRFRALEADAERLRDGIDEHAPEAESLVTDWADELVRLAQTFASDMEAIGTGGAPFSVSFEVEESGLLVFDRSSVDGALDVVTELNQVGLDLIEAIEQIQRLAEQRASGSANAIGALRSLLATVERSASSIDGALTSQPLSVFELKITSERSELGEAFDEVRAALNGRNYTLGDGVTQIRPVALVEQLDGGLYPLVLDFFRTPMAQRGAYTFGSLLPAGLPTAVIERSGVDASLSAAADAAVVRQRVRNLKSGFESRLAGGEASFDAHAGMGLALSFELVDEHVGALEDAVALLMQGDFETLLDRHADGALDAAERAEEAARHFDLALSAADGAYDAFVFTLRLDEQGDPNAPSDGDFVPLVVTSGMIRLLSDAVTEVGAGISTVSAELAFVVEEADSGFDTYLDPNRLDFSAADTPYRAILALQRGNPDFLALKPLGERRMREAGDAIRDALPDLADAAAEIAQALRDATLLESLFPDEHVDLMSIVADAEQYAFDVRDDFLFHALRPSSAARTSTYRLGSTPLRRACSTPPVSSSTATIEPTTPSLASFPTASSRPKSRAAPRHCSSPRCVPILCARTRAFGSKWRPRRPSPSPCST